MGGGLCAHGACKRSLVNRTYHPTIPPKVEYNLTEMGQSFREPVNTLGYWALENLSKIDAAREVYDANAATTASCPPL